MIIYSTVLLKTLVFTGTKKTRSKTKGHALVDKERLTNSFTNINMAHRPTDINRIYRFIGIHRTHRFTNINRTHRFTRMNRTYILKCTGLLELTVPTILLEFTGRIGLQTSARHTGLLELTGRRSLLQLARRTGLLELTIRIILLELTKRKV